MHGLVLQPADLPPEIASEDTEALSPDARQQILDALARAGGNRAAAARLLGVGRSTLYRRLRALGIE